MPDSPPPVVPNTNRLGLLPGVRLRQAFAWASMDFANSGYTTVVLTAVFNAYFVSAVMSDAALGTLAWTLILSLSYLLVMVSAPILGAYADLCAQKKRLLVISTWGCVVATGLLATVGPGMWAWAAVLLVISNLCYATNQNLVAAFISEIAAPEHLGRISGYGWAWGYFGGLAALGLSLVWVGFAQAENFSAQGVVGGTMVITAVLFAVVALPALTQIKDRRAAAAALPEKVQEDQQDQQGQQGQQDQHDHGAGPGFGYWVAASWGRLRTNWQQSYQQPDLRRFLICVLIYHAGVHTVITLAAVYAQQVMGFSIQQTIMLILIVNITAAIGAWAFGFLQDRLSHRNSLSIALVFWLLMVLIAWQAHDETTFWIAANFAGIAMGASQSGARAAIAYLSRADRQAETFGLWGVAINMAAVLGPVTYGLVTWLSQNDQRLAMVVTGVFFLVGLAVLWTVNFERGRHAANSG